MEIRCRLIKVGQGAFTGSFQNGWISYLLTDSWPLLQGPSLPGQLSPQQRAGQSHTGGIGGGGWRGAKPHASLPSGTVRSVPSWEGVRRVGEVW